MKEVTVLAWVWKGLGAKKQDLHSENILAFFLACSLRTTWLPTHKNVRFHMKKKENTILVSILRDRAPILMNNISKLK